MTMHLGIEIEYLVASENGQPVKSGYNQQNSTDKGHLILKKAANILGEYKIDWDGTHTKFKFLSGGMKGAALMPDTFTLLETVTYHSDDLDYLRDQLWNMKKALIQAAKEYSCWISGAACPVTYSYEIINNPNATFNNAGMHIHIDAASDRDKIKLANQIAQIIPELTALCANSSIYNKSKAGKHSKRLSVSTLASAKMVEVINHDPTKELKWDNPNKRYRWVTQYPKGKKTVEIRGFDTPLNIDWAMAIAALILCVGEKASHLFIKNKANTIVSDKKEYRIDNFEAAVEKGLKAEFQVDATYHRMIHGKKKHLSFLHHDPEALPGSKIPAHLAAKRLLFYIEDEAYRLGLLNYLEPFYTAVNNKKNQADQQIEWFGKGRFSSYLETLTKEASLKPENRKITSEAKRKYFLVRQRSQNAKPGTIELSEKTLVDLKLKAGEIIVASGPLGSFSIKAAVDSRSHGRKVTDREVGLSASVRRKLGLSLFDPVILDKQEIKPFITQKTGPEWYSVKQSSPSELERNVVKGFHDVGPGTAVLSESTVRALRLAAGAKAFIWKEKAHNVQLKIVSKNRFKDSIIGLMEKDREDIGVNIGDRIFLSAKKPVSAVTPSDQGLYKVQQGLKEDSDDPAVIRLHKSAADKLKIKEKDTVEVTAKSGNVMNAVIYLSSKISEKDIALRKNARQKLSVSLGDFVRVKRLEAAGSDNKLTVRKGFKEDENTTPIVRLHPAMIKRLKLEEKSSITLVSAEGNTLDAIVLSSDKCAKDEAALLEALRIKLEVRIGEKISVRTGQRMSLQSQALPTDEPEDEDEESGFDTDEEQEGEEDEEEEAEETGEDSAEGS